jgi:hypothetical protein
MRSDGVPVGGSGGGLRGAPGPGPAGAPTEDHGGQGDHEDGGDDIGGALEAAGDRLPVTTRWEPGLINRP